jgi:two-component system sensor histidine kinase GlrK
MTTVSSAAPPDDSGTLGIAFGMRLANFYYPRSFLKLLLLGFIVVSLPLVVALVNAAVSVQRLAGMSESVVNRAAQAARGSRALLEQVLSMERLVRQFVILDDPSVLDDYDKVRANFKRTAGDLSLLPLDQEQLAGLNRTVSHEQTLYQTLAQRPEQPPERGQLVAGYVDLSSDAQTVLDQSNDLIAREVERMRGSAEGMQRILFLQLVAAFPLGVIIAALFAFLIARPIRQLENAIRQLGGAEFRQGIRVDGPEDLAHLGERLEWLRRRLAELEEQRTRFLRHISHELKTPLTALREGSELLADGTTGSLSSQQREVIGILQSNSVHLQRLIEDLINYQQALAHMSQLALGHIELGRLARSAIEAQKLAAAGGAISFEVDATPTRLVGDEAKLRIVIDNLLSNAVKYSPQGGVVRVMVRDDGDGARLEVADEGPGIPMVDRPKVFDWFFQAERAYGGRIKSSGLGLAIARELVLSHGGTIEIVDSTRGARFRVALPLAPPNTEKLA